MYLIIDTSTRYGVIGLWQDGALAGTRSWHSRGNHTAELMPAVAELLDRKGEGATQLRGVVVTAGPGGFSALRAGMSVAKGMAFALELPLVGVSTLEATAYPYRTLGYPVCAVLEAGRDLAAWARFQETKVGWRRSTRDQVTPFEALLEVASRHTLFCGEGAMAYAQQLRAALGPRAHMAGMHSPMDRLHGAAELGAMRLDAGDSDSVSALQPHYLRPPGITQPRPPHAVRYGADRA
jgi:tRNA threonylcarbamoyladenosine biosynthesis protein TsaB